VILLPSRQTHKIEVVHSSCAHLLHAFFARNDRRSRDDKLELRAVDLVKCSDRCDLSESDSTKEVNKHFLGTHTRRRKELLLLLRAGLFFVASEKVQSALNRSEAPVDEHVVDQTDRDWRHEAEDIVDVSVDGRLWLILIEHQAELTFDFVPVEALVTELQKASILQVQDRRDLLIAVAHDKSSAQLVKFFVFQAAVSGRQE